MKLVIEARLEDDASTASAGPPVTLAVMERKNHDLSDFGPSLAEGRRLLAAAQSALAARQASTWLRAEASCPQCRMPPRHQNSRCIVMRTVFGKVGVVPLLRTPMLLRAEGVRDAQDLTAVPGGVSPADG